MEYQLIRNISPGATCLECGKALHGRPDKKFCSAQCRIRSNNRRHGYTYASHLALMNAMETNYRILESLLLSGANKASLKELKKMGFNTFVVTGHRRSDHHEQFFCFDICYCQSDSKIFLIRRQEWELPPRERSL